jgi:hypothetical protein
VECADGWMYAAQLKLNKEKDLLVNEIEVMEL